MNSSLPQASAEQPDLLVLLLHLSSTKKNYNKGLSKALENIYLEPCTATLRRKK